VKLHRIAALICLSLLPGCGENGGTTQPGKRVADRWCSECHGAPGAHPGHVSPSPVATPSFTQIAQYPEINRQYLEKFFDGIIVMPIYHLSTEEKKEVIDYILSLRAGQ
jgi:mono/diheme cytochrome c family protein